MSTAADSPEDCTLGENCGIHHRVNARHEEGYGFLSYTDYIGEYVIVTSQRTSLMALATILGLDPYDTAVLKVGDMSIHEKAIDAYRKGEDDETWTAWEVTYDSIEKAREGHEMVVQAFRDEMLELKV